MSSRCWGGNHCSSKNKRIHPFNLGSLQKEKKNIISLFEIILCVSWNCAKFNELCKRRLKCDGTRAETRFRLSVKRTSPFKSAGASVQSTTGSRGVRISGSDPGYTMFRSGVKSTGYPLHSSVSPSLPCPTSSCAITFQLDSTSKRYNAMSNACKNGKVCTWIRFLWPLSNAYDVDRMHHIDLNS